MTCRQVAEAKDGRRVTCAGIVLVRQMPGTAGVVFVTLSDETGICNVVVWPSLYERFRTAVVGARLMLVEGKIQRSPEGVVHLVAERIIDRTSELRRLSEDQVPLPGHYDEIVYQRPDSRAPIHRHPRDVKILPNSRDFH